MKTIEHKGNVYQKGTVYEFSDDDGETWCVDTLEGIYPESNHPYKTRSGDYRLIRVYEASLGTITEAPVKLIDGECYQYTDRRGMEWKGYFSAEHDTFCRDGLYTDSDVGDCTNIKLLVVGE